MAATPAAKAKARRGACEASLSLNTSFEHLERARRLSALSMEPLARGRGGFFGRGGTGEMLLRFYARADWCGLGRLDSNDGGLWGTWVEGKLRRIQHGEHRDGGTESAEIPCGWIRSVGIDWLVGLKRDAHIAAPDVAGILDWRVCWTFRLGEDLSGFLRPRGCLEPTSGCHR
jgi:hypothetical protein